MADNQAALSQAQQELETLENHAGRAFLSHRWTSLNDRFAVRLILGKYLTFVTQNTGEMSLVKVLDIASILLIIGCDTWM